MIDILETAAITVSGFLIKKYVFLEPDMEAKKQRIFYWISFFLIGIVFLIFGKDAATMSALLLIGISICLGRKKHRLRGVFLMVPFPGIINGLLVPVLLVPPYLLGLTAEVTLFYQFMVYGVLFLGLIIFYVKGKEWRSWFDENMQHRRLGKSEKYLLWMVGILMLFFSREVASQTGTAGADMMAPGGILARLRSSH